MSSSTTSAQAERRLSWTFEDSITDPAERQARALEYIAMYLDRIETSLAQVAEQVSPKQSRGDGTPLTDGLAFQLQALVKAAKIAGP